MCQQHTLELSAHPAVPTTIRKDKKRHLNYLKKNSGNNLFFLSFDWAKGVCLKWSIHAQSTAPHQREQGATVYIQASNAILTKSLAVNSPHTGPHSATKLNAPTCTTTLINTIYAFRATLYPLSPQGYNDILLGFNNYRLKKQNKKQFFFNTKSTCINFKHHLFFLDAPVIDWWRGLLFETNRLLFFFYSPSLSLVFYPPIHREAIRMKAANDDRWGINKNEHRLYTRYCTHFILSLNDSLYTIIKRAGGRAFPGDCALLMPTGGAF